MLQLIMQSPNIVLYDLCKVKIAEVTVSDASAHTVPTYNATALTVKSSTKSSSLCQASLEHLKACCFFPDKKGMKHDIHLQSGSALTESKPEQHNIRLFKLLIILKVFESCKSTL